jgi:hypothetical protein
LLGVDDGQDTSDRLADVVTVVHTVLATKVALG